MPHRMISIIKSMGARNEKGEAGGSAGRRQAVQRRLPRARAAFYQDRRGMTSQLVSRFGTDVCLLLGVPSEARDALPRRQPLQGTAGVHL